MLVFCCEGVVLSCGALESESEDVDSSVSPLSALPVAVVERKEARVMGSLFEEEEDEGGALCIIPCFGERTCVGDIGFGLGGATSMESSSMLEESFWSSSDSESESSTTCVLRPCGDMADVDAAAGC